MEYVPGKVDPVSIMTPEQEGISDLAILTRAVEAQGGTVVQHTFDSGQSVAVTLNGQRRWFDHNWGDDTTAATKALRAIRRVLA